MADSKFVVYDRNVERYAMELAGDSPAFAITADEEHKTFSTVMDICRWLLDNGADRDALVLAVGGGCTTDMVGFAASIYKRGVRYKNYPTTLLSMVDAAIGGKTGVNLDGYKNMIGTFRLPVRTEIHPEYLKSLPEREFRSGAAELLKTFIIDNRKSNYAKAVRILSQHGNLDDLSQLISAAADTKRKIVFKDMFEDNVRRHLNLGHTYGHAIEWWQSQAPGRTAYTHGEAVAIGIIKAARISENLHICKPGLADTLASDFSACGLPTELPAPEEELLPAIRCDKKSAGDTIRFVVIKKIGKVDICDIPFTEI